MSSPSPWLFPVSFLLRVHCIFLFPFNNQSFFIAYASLPSFLFIFYIFMETEVHVEIQQCSKIAIDTILPARKFLALKRCVFYITFYMLKFHVFENDLDAVSWLPAGSVVNAPVQRQCEMIFIAFFMAPCLYFFFLSPSMPNHNNPSITTFKIWAVPLKFKMQKAVFLKKKKNRFSMLILRMSHSSWKCPSKLLWNNHGCYYTHLQMWFNFSGTPLHFEWELAALKDLTSHWKTIKGSRKMNLRLFFRFEIYAFLAILQPPKCFQSLINVSLV